MDPLTLALLAGGGSAIGQVGQFLGAAPQREQQRLETRLLGEQGQRRQSIFDQILGGKFGQIGSPGFGQGQFQQQLARFQQAIQPQFDRTAANTFSQTGLNSPLSQKIAGGQRAQITAGRAGQLQDFSSQLGQNRDLQLLRILGGI